MIVPRRYWFRAKRHGWGWGLPLTWEGWVFFFAWLATIIAGAIRLRRSLPLQPVLYAGWILLMLAIMLVVCFWKGEPLRGRWGDRNGPRTPRPPQ
jgi:hypothetical protein